ncbi:hypothetical protein Tam10B_0684 [Bifidobacterium vansinderenii]|uniref:Uncharacterized protein n=1 Tax=Bifidobacterium vansinderenii TaxID=1984871 RepID=A0A229VZT9_9BIFI|nr:hypothetical protein Tam10B_0684 [Bifidobacterium vansinderenii]
MIGHFLAAVLEGVGYLCLFAGLALLSATFRLADMAEWLYPTKRGGR